MPVGQAHQYKIRLEQEKKDSSYLLGKFWENYNLNLKDATVQQVSKEIAKDIILKYEWLGTMSTTSHHYGIFFGDICGGVVCFGNNCTANFNVPHEFGLKLEEVWTLARGACTHWTPKGSASKLISQALKLFKKDVPEAKVIIAYSDVNAGEIGTVYQATNWYYIGVGNRSTVNFYNIEGNRKFDERKLHDLKDEYHCTRTEVRKKLLEHGWKIETKAIKHKYIFILANHKQTKEILSKVKVLPYPKRNDDEKKNLSNIETIN